MMKKILITLLFSVSSLTTWARNLPARWNRPLQGSFLDERRIAGFASKITSTGHFAIDSKKGLTWATQTPFPSTVHLSPEGKLTIENDGQIQVQTIPSSFSRLFLAIFSGNNAVITRRFIVRQKKPQGYQYHYTLTPKTPQDKKWIQSLRLQGNDYPCVVDWVDPQGMKIHIRLTAEKNATII